MVAVNRRWSPGIAIPARNEEERLPRLLAALDAQTWAAAQPLPVTIVMNNCTDRTAAAVRDAAPNYPNLQFDLVEVDYPGEEAHVGTARRMAMDRVLGTPGVLPQMAAVLTTDADATPLPDWVEANLAALDAGADLVGGRIIGDAAEEAMLGEGFNRRAFLQAHYAQLSDHLTALIDPLPHDPWPRHQDHTGASLCVRGDVYHAVGGLPVLSFREDLGFVSRARAKGFCLRHDPAVRVGVSARLEGRAPGGMADTLKAWLAAVEAGAPQLVEAPVAVEKRARCRAALRNLDKDGQAGPADSELDGGLLGAARKSGLKGIALIELLAPDEPDAEATTPIEAAIAELETLIAARKRAVAAA